MDILPLSKGEIDLSGLEDGCDGQSEGWRGRAAEEKQEGASEKLVSSLLWRCGIVGQVLVELFGFQMLSAGMCGEYLVYHLQQDRSRGDWSIDAVMECTKYRKDEGSMKRTSSLRMSHTGKQQKSNKLRKQTCENPFCGKK